MSFSPTNYDALAPTYNDRYQRGDSMSGVWTAIQSALPAPSPQTLIPILEVGCGTGHWLEQLQRLGHVACGLDYSWGMLQQATQRAGLPGRLTRGTAIHLPYAAQTFAVVLCINALHHFPNQPQFVAEARRVLRPGGQLFIAGMEPRASAWYVYDYFTGVRERDVARFAPWEQIAGWLRAAGFENVTHTVAERLGHPWEGAAVFDDPFLQRHNSSQLAAVNDADYAAGLARMQADIAAAAQAGQTLTFANDIPLTLLHGVVAGLGSRLQLPRPLPNR